ncbi:hypothetical protein A1OE_133 [Candidatus Endolissoclinum faulkneri L2]|uniref:Uncharacterized protein n=1 Tax=Candidatus Endolissoclinum faulkneri L2 TaxID=1193729 RepID=K7YLH0_9PROT|nr:hypothetical protein A1OE_133 [Candidatus Endolissoclinum faulkneri L2]
MVRLIKLLLNDWYLYTQNLIYEIQHILVLISVIVVNFPSNKTNLTNLQSSKMLYTYVYKL